MIRPLALIAAYDALSAVLLVQVGASASQPALAFGPGEIAVVTALLVALSGAFVATAKLLLDSKDSQLRHTESLRLEQLATAENLRREMLDAAEKLRLEQVEILRASHASQLDVLRLQAQAKRPQDRA